MNKNLLDYLNGNTNAFKCEVVISREKNPNGYEYIHVSIEEYEIYKFWNNPKKRNSDKPPKHTGGKPSFVKLYLKRLRELRKEGITPDLIGYMVSLSDNIEWNNNLIVDNRRTKKPLKLNDIAVIFMLKERQTKEVIKRLKECNLLIKDKDGFKVSPDFLQRGGAKNG